MLTARFGFITGEPAQIIGNYSCFELSTAHSFVLGFILSICASRLAASAYCLLTTGYWLLLLLLCGALFC
jgi:hypothetical protein